MAHNPKRVVTIEEAEAIIKRWEISRLQSIGSRGVRPASRPSAGGLAALHEFFASDQTPPAGLRRSQFKSAKAARVFASSTYEGKSSEAQELMDFEQATWDLYELRGTLDHTRLLFECQTRAQNGDNDAKRILAVLDSFHKDRHKDRNYRWNSPLYRPLLPEVVPDTQVQVTLGPRLWALLIGNNNYPQSPLEYSVNDAKAWKSYLIDFLGVPESHIVLLQDANRVTMVTALYDLRDNPNIKEGDHILFAFSGHGSSVDAQRYSFENDIKLRAGSIEALCPVDRGLPPGRGTPDISDRELLLVLSDIHDQTKANITVVLDCCHAGGGTRESGEGDGRGCVQRSRSLAPFVDPKLIERMFTMADDHPRRRPSSLTVRSPGWASNTVGIYRPVLLAACQDTELAYEENKHGHGVFTAALMEVLRSTQRNDLTCSGLIEAISPLRRNQKPRFDGEDGVLFKIGSTT